MEQIANKLEDINTLAPLPENQGLSDISGNASDTILQTMWGLNASTMNEVVNIGKVYSSKHGLFASIPIICRGNACPYKDVCMVKKAERKVGVRCPMEIAAIMSRFTQYCQHFEIDIDMPTVAPEHLVDVSLIKDLVTIEVAMMRAENKIAMNGDFMASTLLDIDKKCNPYFGQIVSPEQEHLMTLQEKKQKVLNQLNATRKDHAKQTKSNQVSNSMQICKEINEKLDKAMPTSITDMSFDEEVVDPVIVETATQETVKEPEIEFDGGDINGAF